MIVKLLYLICVLLEYFIHFAIIADLLSEQIPMHESSIRVNAFVHLSVDGFTRVCYLLLLHEPKGGCSDDEL